MQAGGGTGGHGLQGSDFIEMQEQQYWDTSATRLEKVGAKRHHFFWEAEERGAVQQMPQGTHLFASRSLQFS